jgi:hypothetical protein
MSQTNTIKDAERQVFQLATFEDGFWEIYLGLFFALMSIYSLTRRLLGPVINAVCFLGAALVLVGLVWLVKRAFTLPRIGVVRFGSGTKRAIKTTHLITWALVIATFAIMILSAGHLLNEPTWKALPQWVSDFDVDMVFALVIIATFSLAAYTMGLPRFYLYGFLLGVSNFTSTVLHVYEGVLFQWPVALAAGIIIASGIMVLLKFRRKYPLPREAQNDGP